MTIVSVKFWRDEPYLHGRAWREIKSDKFEFDRSGQVLSVRSRETGAVEAIVLGPRDVVRYENDSAAAEGTAGPPRGRARAQTPG